MRTVVKIRFQMFFTILLLLVLITSVCSQKTPTIAGKNKKSPKVKITYIANEGVFIESGNKRVLIDGLLRFYKPAFAFPPDDLRSLLEHAQKPFAYIDLILVSHLHGDHFHPKSVSLHLQNSPRAKLVTSNQIIDEVKKDSESFEKIKSQVLRIDHKWKKSESKNFGEIKVKFLGLRHANKNFNWIQNLGHLIEIHGRKFLHIGDADMTDENFAVYNLHKENIDIAFIPYWFLLSEAGRTLIKNQFNPKHIVAVHVSPNDAEKVSKKLKTLYPDITIFTKIREEKTF